MSSLDRQLLAEKTAAVERHLTRVAARLPAHAADLLPSSDASDAVVLHLWQAVQIVIDLALSCCLHEKLGAPSTYADAFRRLAEAGFLDAKLAERLTRASGFCNRVAHAYERLDMAKVHEAALSGPEDLREFLRVLRDR
ncbi:MAG: DUF86 domain-containing protein [Polyangiaceae bacterium]